MLVRKDYEVSYEWVKYDEVKAVADTANYKSVIKSIGSSDIASLTLRFPTSVEMLHFGEDNSYKAYIITEETEVPSHYTKVAGGTHWLKIYDDEELAIEFKANNIEVYRAGEMGCLIKVAK